MQRCYFALVFALEDVGQIPVPKPEFGGKASEELCQIDETSDQVLGLTGKLKTNKSLGPDS